MRLLFLTLLLTLATYPAFAVNGLWKTEGYGFLFEIKGKIVRIFELTDRSCLESVLQPGPLESGRDETEGRFSVTVPGFIDASIQILPGPDASTKFFRRTDTATPMTARRIDHKPERCAQPQLTDHAAALEILFATFDEHYPFFDLKGIAWDRDRAWRSVAAAADEEEAYRTVIDLLEPLYDPHVAIVAPRLERMFFGHEENPNRPKLPDAASILQNVETRYADGAFVDACDGLVAYGLLSKKIAYLKLNGFATCGDHGSFASHLTAFEAILDAVFATAENWSGLVIDVRSNDGGSDNFAQALTSRLTNQPYPAYIKQATIDFAERGLWTPKKVAQIQPSGRPGFHGAVVLLTDFNSVSAAETFAIGLEARQPEIKRVGGTTRGAFSDILPRILPNGWLLGLPNERYVNAAGASFDQHGLKPDVRVAFDPGAFADGIDNRLEAALRLLGAD